MRTIELRIKDPENKLIGVIPDATAVPTTGDHIAIDGVSCSIKRIEFNYNDRFKLVVYIKISYAVL